MHYNILKNKEVKDYMALPYTRLVQELNDESGHYFYGRILELDGCQSTGNTLEELYESMNEAMEGYLEVMLEEKLPAGTSLRCINWLRKRFLHKNREIYRKNRTEAVADWCTRDI